MTEPTGNEDVTQAELSEEITKEVGDAISENEPLETPEAEDLSDVEREED